jgi:acetyl esterase/lipase
VSLAHRVGAFALFLLAAACASGSDNGPVGFTVEIQTYKTVDGTELEAHVYRPAGSPGQDRPVAVLFHGGGWFVGAPEWMSARAERLASLGMVAVSFQYRLSDQETVTPLEAMSDVRDAIRWVRRNAASLGVDTGRVAALGVSAGGHLAVAAALIDPAPQEDEPSAAANAFVLWYPALSLAHDGWLRRILLDRVPVEEIDPVENVRTGVGPTLIFVGANDSLTPLAGQLEFCSRMTEAGNECAVQSYEGLGHLFMQDPWGEGDQPSDSVAGADASQRAERFLDSLGYLRRPHGGRNNRP